MGTQNKNLSYNWWHECFSIGLKYEALLSLRPLGKSLKMFKRFFSQCFSKLSHKHHICSYFLRLDHSPLRSWQWKGLLNTYSRFKRVSELNFLELHQKQTKRCKTQKQKEKFWLDTRYDEMVRKMNVTHLFHDASKEYYMNE